ncbi:KUP/HAK/KT family potassium transporter, partial [Streptomyces sp. NRRL F-5123]|uniref:KUP/HAK/KT family potassium transporter n=1 Tax=Streptomyces sp. NRRL F-5123 TaxID=1463856 RepID=UPI0022799C69
MDLAVGRGPVPNGTWSPPPAGRTSFSSERQGRQGPCGGAAAGLVVTGAEALYADMGHFGRRSITRAWVFLVFPACVL